jgi:hypothetical protein
VRLAAARRARARRVFDSACRNTGVNVISLDFRRRRKLLPTDPASLDDVDAFLVGHPQDDPDIRRFAAELARDQLVCEE